jgi:hypothetical protein
MFATSACAVDQPASRCQLQGFHPRPLDPQADADIVGPRCCANFQDRWCQCRHKAGCVYPAAAKPTSRNKQTAPKKETIGGSPSIFCSSVTGQLEAEQTNDRIASAGRLSVSRATAAEHLGRVRRPGPSDRPRFVPLRPHREGRGGKHNIMGPTRVKNTPFSSPMSRQR